MPNMLVLVPTRGRPDNIRRLDAAWRSTAATADLLLLLDDDDEHLVEYIGLGIPYVVGPRRRIGPPLNEQAVAATSEYAIIGFMGDDHVPRTDHWDALIAGVLTETGIAYGNDLLQGEALPTAAFLTSDIVQTLGYFLPPELLHMYFDNAWLEWGRGADCLHYVPEVVIEHMHPGIGKAVSDDSYRESNSLMEVDRISYLDYCEKRLAADLEKIRSLRG